MITRDDVFDRGEIEEKRDYITDYEYVHEELMTQIQLMKDVITNTELMDTLDWLVESFEETETSRYEEIKNDVDEYDNFNPLDYNDNDGLKEEYERGKLGNLN